MLYTDAQIYRKFLRIPRLIFQIPHYHYILVTNMRLFDRIICFTKRGQNLKPINETLLNVLLKKCSQRKKIVLINLFLMSLGFHFE